MRIILSLLILSLSFITQAHAEQVTSPFVFESTKETTTKIVDQFYITQNNFFDSESEACSAYQKLRDDNSNIFVYTVVSSSNGNCKLKRAWLKDEDNYEYENAKIFKIRKKVKSSVCKSSSTSKTTVFLMSPGVSAGGSEICKGGCVWSGSIDHIAVTKEGEEVHFKGKKTSSSCKLKPFDKDDTDNGDDDDPEPQPLDCEYDSQGNYVCVDPNAPDDPPDVKEPKKPTKCLPSYVYDENTKKCHSPDNPNDMKEPDKNCPDGYFYHAKTNQCLYDPNSSSNGGNGDNGGGGNGNGDNGNGDNDNGNGDNDNGNGDNDNGNGDNDKDKGGEDNSNILCENVDSASILCKVLGKVDKFISDDKPKLPKKTPVPVNDPKLSDPSKFDKDYVKINAQCPPDVQKVIPIGPWSVTLVIPVTPICQFAEVFMKPILILLAYIYTALSIANAFKV